MALYRPNYWNNYPEPFYADWKQEPIPGWGARPVMAGPARVGVGQENLDDWDSGAPPASSRAPLGPDEQPCQRGGLPVPCDAPGASYAFNPGMAVSRPWLARAPAPRPPQTQDDAAQTQDDAGPGEKKRFPTWLPWVVGGGALVAITALLVKAGSKRTNK